MIVCLSLLEAERATVTTRHLETQAGPFTVYEGTGGSDAPVVYVAHGFAGSRQMMQYISRDLARSGFTVLAFDFIGHGRHTGRLSPDVTVIEGTTRQLVDQTLSIIDATRPLFPDAPDAIGVVGHSMATDIIIRAAQQNENIASIVAISMYSDVVTAQFPAHLLILSGEWEGRLRIVGNRLIKQVNPEASEGQTARAGDVLRRAVSIPRTEHVAVLFSTDTLREIRDWLRDGLKQTQNIPAETRGMGGAVGGALLSVLAVLCLVTRVLPVASIAVRRLATDRFALALGLPAIGAVAAALLSPASLLGYAGFGTLLVFLLVWGGIQLWCVFPGNWKATGGFSVSGALYLAGGALCFALLLDRYAAAFLPVDERLALFAILFIGTLPFALADRILAARTAVWQRLVARTAVISLLAIQMVFITPELGLLFTVLPVLVLFFLVYGTLAHFVALRTGPLGAGLSLGAVLAWSIAASTPLFQG